MAGVAVGDLLTEAGRGLDALLGREIVLAALAAIVVVVAVVWSARRHDHVPAGWPLLVVGGVALGVRGRAVMPLLAAAAGWWVLQRLDVRAPTRPGVLLGAVGITGLGLFGTLPQTEEAIALLAATLVVALAIVTRGLEVARVSAPQIGALLGLLVWVCVAGDGQRPRALLAGLLCVAMLAAVAVLLDAALAPLFVLHVGVTAAASRWVGLAPDPSGALIRSLPVVGIALVGVLLLQRTVSPAQPSSTP